ncbi:MAG: hypothetical protein IJK38_12985, partial [Oscillospiraceae bacterium]|nr:hypothetical protein [Oscillospiraceae bacterium]
MKTRVKIILSIVGLSLSIISCSSGVNEEEHNRVVAEKESLAAELESVSKEYAAYKESMAEYEGLADAEAIVRKLEADLVLESK